jgi:hypothetical protein
VTVWAFPAEEVTMTSAITGPASGAGGRHAEGRGWGLVTSAAVLLALVGTINLMYGIAAVASPGVFTDSERPRLDSAGGHRATF